MKVQVPEATKCLIPILDLFNTQNVISVSSVRSRVKASFHSGLDPCPQQGAVLTHCVPRVISQIGSFWVNKPVLWSNVARRGLMLTSCPLASILATQREDVALLELQGLLAGEGR